MTGPAGQSDRAEATHAAHDEGLVRVAIVSLPGTITRRMAVHTTRVQNHLARLGKKGDGTLLIVDDG
jgi:hypothetical protein